MQAASSRHLHLAYRGGGAVGSLKSGDPYRRICTPDPSSAQVLRALSASAETPRKRRYTLPSRSLALVVHLCTLSSSVSKGGKTEAEQLPWVHGSSRRPPFTTKMPFWAFSATHTSYTYNDDCTILNNEYSIHTQTRLRRECTIYKRTYYSTHSITDAPAGKRGFNKPPSPAGSVSSGTTLIGFGSYSTGPSQDLD
jgi:hypothetical protein